MKTYYTFVYLQRFLLFLILSYCKLIVNKYKEIFNTFSFIFYNYLIKYTYSIFKERVYMRKKIYRSKSNRMITGVCGGLGEYFNIDPNIIRLFWLILSISTNGAGIIAYFVSSIIIPEDNSGVTYYENDNYNGQNTYKKNAVCIDIALIIVAVMMMSR